MIIYLNKFFPKMLNLTKPLRGLLHKGTTFTWEIHHEEALSKIEEVLLRPPVQDYMMYRKL